MVIILVICLTQIITFFNPFKIIILFFQKFATEGLRTLLLGIRDLTEQEFNNWKTAHHNAAIALENREAKLDEVYDTIERDLDILGATAIEDKLQV
jgi:magnesium-transporting ATPase (P-type)